MLKLINNSVKASVDAEARRLKLDAMEQGQFTDFCFLVGPEGNSQLMHCFKSDLLVSSEFFRALLSNMIQPGERKPVRIHHVQPHIFKQILRFISLYTIDEIEISNVDDALAFTFAADEFHLEPLRPFCKNMIEKILTVENVWHILNLLCKIPQMQPDYNEVLITKTLECLAHPSFLQASEESLIYLLQHDVLNIDSEKDLVDACIYLAQSKPLDEGFRLLRAVLPHLRLLTLKNTTMKPALLECLTNDEKLYLFTSFWSEENDVKDSKIPTIFSFNSTPRGRQFSTTPQLKVGTNCLEIVPEDMVITTNYDLTSSSLEPCVYSNVYWLRTICDASLTGIDIFAPAKNLNQKSSFEKKADTEVDVGYFSPVVQVYHKTSAKFLHKESFEFRSAPFSSNHLSFSTDIFIPRNEWFGIQILYKEMHQFVGFSEDECHWMVKKTLVHPILTGFVVEDPSNCNIVENWNMCKCLMIKNVHLNVKSLKNFK